MSTATYVLIADANANCNKNRALGGAWANVEAGDIVMARVHGQASTAFEVVNKIQRDPEDIISSIKVVSPTGQVFTSQDSFLTIIRCGHSCAEVGYVA